MHNSTLLNLYLFFYILTLLAMNWSNDTQTHARAFKKPKPCLIPQKILIYI